MSKNNDPVAEALQDKSPEELRQIIDGLLGICASASIMLQPISLFGSMELSLPLVQAHRRPAIQAALNLASEIGEKIEKKEEAHKANVRSHRLSGDN